MKQKSFKQIDTAIFILIWLVVFLSPLIVQNEGTNTNWKRLLDNWVRLLPFLGLSVVNHYILAPKLFFNNIKRWYFVSVPVIIGVFSYSLFLITESQRKSMPKPFDPRTEHLRPDKRPFPVEHRADLPPKSRRDRDIKKRRPQGPPRQQPGALPPGINAFIVALLVIGFDTGLMTIFKWNESEQARIKLQKDNIDSQLAFLRNQVSPHFFMNTLNNIHALIDIDTDEAKDSVIRLSKLMRLLLYDSEQDLITLEKEVDFIKNYMDLMRLRFTNKVKISLNIPEELPKCVIPPLLFTSYLENAFKHGISYQEESFVKVDLLTRNEQLEFIIENSNPKIKTNDKASGIGMINAKRRLDLLYKQNYTLKVIDETDIFIVNLSIPI